MTENLEGTISLWSRVQMYRAGELVNPSEWERGHSFVRNLMYALESAFSQRDVTAGGWDTTNTLEGFEQGTHTVGFIRASPLGAEDTYGILLGTDSTAVTLSDYNLGTPIAHGSGAGQLLYGAGSVAIPFEDSTDSWVDIVMVRGFENQSGGNITVEEIGIVGKSEDAGGASELFLLAHDLKNFTINDGYTAVVEYRLRFTV